MKLAFGGDSILYLSLPGVAKALNESTIDIDEIHCVGFSCIPLFFSEYYKSADRAFSVMRHIWRDVDKIFQHPDGNKLIRTVELVKTLYRLGKPMQGVTPIKALEDFVDKYFPDITIDKVPRLKIHAFNLKTYDDEIVSGSLREAMKMTLAFPIQFGAYKDHVSGANVYGIPEGDMLFLLNMPQNAVPRNALDYMMLSTIARTSEIIRYRKEKARYVIEFSSTNPDPDHLVPQLYKNTRKKLKALN
ncbi:hypothetical protein [Kosmotoga pacifica]|uniref:PNPLA domain-containing protein n=1 Tax=Kosmotoga pacifica TaxID=1330330 RepID=A0A0G2ZD55_9BACT|nr:hypothetical protein [Kosmotoga pacifica]AKI97996.1 hypothetical protein IX53_09345 [Kosmotoga pacifica]